MRRAPSPTARLMSDAMNSPFPPFLPHGRTGLGHWSGGRGKAAGRCRTHPSQARGEGPWSMPQHHGLSTSTSQAPHRLEHKIDSLVNRLVAAIVIALTLLFAALHYWPTHG